MAPTKSKQRRGALPALRVSLGGGLLRPIPAVQAGATSNAVIQSFLLIALIPVLLLLVGTLGYHFLEGWTYFDALYMTVVTLTTVGYEETHRLSQAGRAFTDRKSVV